MTKKESYISFITDELNKGNVQYKDVLSLFVSKWQVSERTFVRHWNKANDTHTEYLNRLNKEKEAQSIESEKEAVKLAILTKEQRKEIASNIALGKARKVQNQIIIPTDGDRIRALDYLAKVEGDYTATKVEATIQTGTILWGDKEIKI